MKNFISFNIQTYKKSDAKGLILHSHKPKSRNKSTNITFPEYQKYNINSDGDSWSKYQQITKQIEDLKGKKIQKNANHFLEGVLAFSFDKFKENSKEFREKAPELIEQYMQNICEEYGFEPVGWSLHFDEGYIDKKTGKKKLNVHAHVQMVNFDFNTEKARFREYQQKYVKKRKVPNLHFVKMQDMANDVFAEKLGFVRGVSKSKTNKVHLDKEDHVVEKLKKKEQKLDDLDALIDEKTEDYQYFSEQIENLRKDYSDLETDVSELRAEKSDLETEASELRAEKSSIKASIRGLFDTFNKRVGVLVKSLLKRDFESVQEQIQHVQDVIDTSYDDFDDDGSGSIGDTLVDNANTATEPHYGGKAFKKRKKQKI